MKLFNRKNIVGPELNDAVDSLFNNQHEIVLVCLCTTDGFAIKLAGSKELMAEADKLAAISSTISSLSDSAAKQLLNDDFLMTIVETAIGNLLFVRTTYLGSPCVLTIVCKNKMSLALVRITTKELAQKISKIAIADI